MVQNVGRPCSRSQGGDHADRRRPWPFVFGAVREEVGENASLHRGIGVRLPDFAIPRFSFSLSDSATPGRFGAASSRIPQMPRPATNSPEYRRTVAFYSKVCIHRQVRSCKFGVYEMYRCDLGARVCDVIDV